MITNSWCFANLANGLPMLLQSNEVDANDNDEDTDDREDDNWDEGLDLAA